MKTRNMTLVCIIVLFVSCIGYIAIDCFRLIAGEPGTKPIIMVDVEEDERKIKYTGIGCSVVYHYDDIVKLNGMEMDGRIYGADIWLFDSILLWGWVACG